MEDISIRSAVNGDLAAIADIELGAAILFPERDLPDVIRFNVTDADTLRDAIGAGRLWIAENTALRPVGFALVETLDGAPHLAEVDVLPEFGRQGIGRRLVETVIDWARGDGAAGITLITFRHLAWNAPFYEKLGFLELAAGDIGPEFAALMEEEAREGIDSASRVAMRLTLQ